MYTTGKSGIKRDDFLFPANLKEQRTWSDGGMEEDGLRWKGTCPKRKGGISTCILEVNLSLPLGRRYHHAPASEETPRERSARSRLCIPLPGPRPSHPLGITYPREGSAGKTEFLIVSHAGELCRGNLGFQNGLRQGGSSKSYEEGYRRQKFPKYFGAQGPTCKPKSTEVLDFLNVK